MLAAVPGASIARQVIWLALPVLVEQALLYLVGFSDTVLTGRYLRVEHLAAVTVSSYLLWFLGSLLIVVSAGATALVARLIGGGQREAAVRIGQQAIGLAWIVGLAIMALGLGAAPAIIRAMNLIGPAQDEAIAYLRIVLAVTPLLASEAVGVACLRGAGDTRTGMWVMIVVNTINIALSWAFVTGIGPFPALGLRGVALGTAIGEGTGGLLVLWVLARGRSGLILRRRGLRPVWADVRRILRISLPAAGESLTNAACQLWFLRLINRLGETATAAHGVAIRCESIAFLTVMAFSVAASTLTGQYLGAGRPDLAGKAARTAWGIGVAVLSLLGVLLYTEARPMFALFLGRNQPGVEALGVPVLRVVAFALPALATIAVLSGSLRGAGDTRWPWAIVVFGYLAIRLPGTYYLTLSPSEGGLGWGLFGAWIAMFADLCVRGALVAARFLQGGWRRVRV
ncbi:MAG: MATE family efflux transporter [Isosphaeraceae bacterium]|nr:MATE family efflux transporter [Isosphaeraceae bacterium]